MTQKEKLYREYVIAKNKLLALRGEALIGGDDIEVYFNSYAFSNRANHHTIKEIRRMIDYAKRCYEDEYERLRIENYYNTEEGKAVKEALLDRIWEMENKRKDCIETATEQLDNMIKEWLGAEWGVAYVCSGSMDIGLVEERKNNVNCFYFGHSFQLYYDSYVKEESRFEMNYGCMGSFNLLKEDGNLRCKFLMGMGTFANDKEKLAELKKATDKFVAELNKINSELDDLTHDYRNPFDEKRAA